MYLYIYIYIYIYIYRFTFYNVTDKYILISESHCVFISRLIYVHYKVKC